MRKKAFTLVELLIVISILGIMAAIVMPTFQGHLQKAKEAAAKDNLRILRTAIEAYAAQHNGTPPGYLNDDPARIPSGVILSLQLVPDYLKTRPENPFNALNTFQTIANGVAFPTDATDAYGWVYKPQTKKVQLDKTGTDSEGISYFDY